MGYRLRLGEIDKKIAEKFRHKSYKEIMKGKNKDEEFNYLVLPQGYKQLYELGKYVSYNKGTKRFYTRFNIKKREYDFFIMSKEGLRYIIEEYAESTKTHYEELFNKAKTFLQKPPVSAKMKRAIIEEFISHFNFMQMEWTNKYCKPYWLDEKDTDGEIVRSWKMQYAIFNLVYIYRTFDWENKYLIYSGW